jgi:hypothetical protein
MAEDHQVNLGLVVAALLLTGCNSTNISELVKALGNDPASVCVNLTSVYANLRVARSNLTNGTMSCTGDGLTVRPGVADAAR